MNLKNDIKKITREEFFNIKEDDVMFITNPGRMGDEDGSTFIVKLNDNYIIYRISGWMYRSNENANDFISFEEMLNHFPKWKEMLDNWDNENYKGKYTYVYMGFGNGLSIDNSIYETFKPYLLDEVKKIKESHGEAEDKPSFNYSAWLPALETMINNNNN